MRGCICNTNFSIIINGRLRGKIRATRGLRQGDPLSPFLFILVVDCLSHLLTQAADLGLIKGFSTGSDPLHIHHLQFADNTILFSLDEDEAIKNLFQIVKTFEEASGLNIILTKSKILGLNIEVERLNSIATVYDCKVGSWPNSYLGLPLNANPNTASFWAPVIEKIERCLHSWQHSFVSNLPTYYLSLFAMPNRVGH